MAEVEFIFNGTKEIIQCKENEIMKNICQNYIKKIDENQNNIYFSYNGIAGNKFDENLTFDQTINSEDKKRNRMSILVSTNESEEEENNIIKSKDIICPICGESIRIDIKDYKIALFECKNKHKIDNKFNQKLNKIITFIEVLIILYSLLVIPRFVNINYEILNI